VGRILLVRLETALSTSYSSNAQLQKPSVADRNWDVPLNSNIDVLDALTAIGGLATTLAEIPSATLNVRISTGDFRKGDGTIGTFAGASSIAVPPSATSSLWLTDAGLLSVALVFPPTAHVRIASVVAGPISIISIRDKRIQCASSGSGLGFVLKVGDTLSDGANISLGSNLGTMIGTAATQKLGFFGSMPASQPTALAAINDSTGGTPGGSVSNVGSTYNQAAINSNISTLAAMVNGLIAAMKHNGLMAT
jgi:hypothetical protein